MGALFFANPGNSKSLHLPFMPQTTKTAQLEINGNTINVEIADNSETRKRGLGGRASLGESDGMLFIFDNLDKHPFWMKGLSFPLDFVWIKEDKVIDILSNIAPPKQGQQDSELPIYSSSSPVDKVLELNAGSIKKLNIKVGDTIIQKP